MKAGRRKSRRVYTFAKLGRQTVLAALQPLVIFSLMGCSNLSESKLSSLRSILIDHIDASGAEVAVAFKDLDSGALLLINEALQMHAASTMKVPVMIEVMRQSLTGGPNLADSIAIENEFKSIVDGSRYAMQIVDDADEVLYGKIGQKTTVNDLIVQMITVSSNLATNILIDLVGAKNIMKTLAEMDVRQMQVLRGVEDMKAYSRGLNNTTNAVDMMKVMEAIVSGKAGSAAHCAQMIEILSAQKFREKIPAGLPADILVANKTGSITGIDHDAAIVFPPNRQPFILVVLTRGFSDHKGAQQFIASLTRLIYQAVVGAPTVGEAK